MRNFVTFAEDGENVAIINLELIRFIDQISPGHIRISFDAVHHVEVTGNNAGLLLARIGNRAVTTDGFELTIPNTMNMASPVPPVKDLTPESPLTN